MSTHGEDCCHPALAGLVLIVRARAGSALCARRVSRCMGFGIGAIPIGALGVLMTSYLVRRAWTGSPAFQEP